MLQAIRFLKGISWCWELKTDVKIYTKIDIYYTSIVNRVGASMTPTTRQDSKLEPRGGKTPRLAIPGDSLASFMAPGFLTTLALTTAYILEALRPPGYTGTLAIIVIYTLMLLPTIGIVIVIATYKKPLATAAGVAIVNLAWYTLNIMGGDSYNYLDLPSILTLILVEEALNIGQTKLTPIIAATTSLTTWTAIGIAILRLRKILHL